jgi:iron complex transport system permease protein
VRNRHILSWIVLIVSLLIALLLAVSFGSERLSIFDLSETQAAIFFDIRFPRVLLGACVGASLASAGASLQALLRNPLAEPYLLGVSNGAALGTMIAFVFFEQVRLCAGRCSRLPGPALRHSPSIRWREAAPG